MPDANKSEEEKKTVIWICEWKEKKKEEEAWELWRRFKELVPDSGFHDGVYW